MKSLVPVAVLVLVCTGCNSHRDVVIKSMRAWGDDSKKCQLVNGNSAVEGTQQQKYKTPAMFCHDDPNPPAFEKWQYIYVGTVKLDATSDKDFDNDKRGMADVLCTRTGARTFECVHHTE